MAANNPRPKVVGDKRITVAAGNTEKKEYIPTPTKNGNESRYTRSRWFSILCSMCAS